MPILVLHKGYISFVGTRLHSKALGVVHISGFRLVERDYIIFQEVARWRVALSRHLKNLADFSSQTNLRLQSAMGEDLIESLYLLQKMSFGEEMVLVERMTASHPLIAKRIGRLETL